MDDLIQQLTSKLGISESVANAATGKVMAMLKDNVGDDIFSKISSAIPGAGDAAESADSAPGGSSGGGLMSSIAGMASGLLGGKAGESVEMGASLSAAGLDTDQIGGFVSTIVDYLKSNVGDEVVEQVVQKFPALRSFIG